MGCLTRCTRSGGPSSRRLFSVSVRTSMTACASSSKILDQSQLESSTCVNVRFKEIRYLLRNSCLYHVGEQYDTDTLGESPESAS